MLEEEAIQKKPCSDTKSVGKQTSQTDCRNKEKERNGLINGRAVAQYHNVSDYSFFYLIAYKNRIKKSYITRTK